MTKTLLTVVLAVAVLLAGLPAIANAQQIAMGGYSVPTAGSFLEGIATGPDGALWFCEYYGNKIGCITPSGAVTEYRLPHANSDPAQITTGPDGALWFTEYGGSRIGRITTGGVIT